jgi:hypothetical protein
MMTDVRVDILLNCVSLHIDELKRKERDWIDELNVRNKAAHEKSWFLRTFCTLKSVETFSDIPDRYSYNWFKLYNNSCELRKYKTLQKYFMVLEPTALISIEEEYFHLLRYNN